MKKLLLLIGLVFFLTPMVVSGNEYQGEWRNVSKQCDAEEKYNFDKNLLIQKNI